MYLLKDSNTLPPISYEAEIKGGNYSYTLNKLGVTPLFFPYIENRIKIILFAAL